MCTIVNYKNNVKKGKFLFLTNQLDSVTSNTDYLTLTIINVVHQFNKAQCLHHTDLKIHFIFLLRKSLKSRFSTPNLNKAKITCFLGAKTPLGIAPESN